MNKLGLTLMRSYVGRLENNELLLLSAPGHMIVNTFGKPDLPIFHMAFKAKSTRAEVPKFIKDSCCGNMAIRRL
jgi:hypothetical protein